MYILEVIPISKSVRIDSLSYFSSKEIPIGAIVNIPLRKKTIHGIVISIQNAENLKSEIKNSDFSLKKLDKVKSIQFFSKPFMNTAKKIANYYATSIGTIINTIVPEYILKNINKLEIGNIESGLIDNEKFAIQGDDEERYGAIKSLIRQEFAKKKSVFILLPTIEDSEYCFNQLEKGIEDYIFILNSSLNSKELINNWNRIVNENHPVAIVTTAGFLSISRNDISTIIIERENNKAYKILRKPYLDIRKLAETLAEENNWKLYFSDNILRIETLWREKENEITQSSPFKFRSLGTSTDLLIDMKKYKSIDSNFRIFSNEIEELINRTKVNSEQMIVLAIRRGIAPSTVCGDCQNIVICNKCSSPVVLHKKNEKSFFMCHRCGEMRSAEEYCKVCNSWKLGIVGIGIDLIVEKIKEKFPDINIFQLDSDKVKTEKVAKSIVQKFKSQPGSILIGTEMMLQYLHDKVDNSAIISLDSLFALPDFRIQEKILQILIRIRSLTIRNFIIQTRKPDEKIFEYGLKGNMIDFYRNTIDERKKYNYPPFSILIKITLEGKKENIIKEMESVQNILDPLEVEVFPAFTQTIKGNHILHGLLRISRENWPNEDLIYKLKSLPLSAYIKVDPETLL